MKSVWDIICLWTLVWTEENDRWGGRVQVFSISSKVIVDWGNGGPSLPRRFQNVLSSCLREGQWKMRSSKSTVELVEHRGQRGLSHKWKRKRWGRSSEWLVGNLVDFTIEGQEGCSSVVYHGFFERVDWTFEFVDKSNWTIPVCISLSKYML